MFSRSHHPPEQINPRDHPHELAFAHHGDPLDAPLFEQLGDLADGDIFGDGYRRVAHDLPRVHAVGFYLFRAVLFVAQNKGERWDKLNQEQQDALLAAGENAEQYFFEADKQMDQERRHRRRPGQRGLRWAAADRHSHRLGGFRRRKPNPHYIEPLFTRHPAQISEIQVLMALLAIKGVYAEYQVNRLNHGIGFDTAAIELLLPAYAESLGLKGRICQHWAALNPHPTLIPVIETGFVKSVHSFDSELGMENYIAARPDVFFSGPDGSMRSNRARCQAAGHYACDMFIGSTPQIDLQGNSSTATLGRIAGFGGAPNMGADARGRRHASPAWLKAGRETRGDRVAMPRGRKLVVQTVETFRQHMQPTFVERLDAWELMESTGMALPPVMIYGDDVTHVVTETGIAHLLLRRSEEERAEAIRGVAGYTPVGLARSRSAVENLRDRGVIRYPKDLDIDKRDATRDLLAARSVKDLVRWSGGLYDPPRRFRNW